MAELVPAPFSDLIHRMRLELERQDAIFDLPRRKWWIPDPDGPDLSVKFHGETAGTPVGPAAGPHTQMAQNLVLSWLAGARIMELKTVQINDRLTIARPCIDVTNIGYNIEWSQELRIAEALREYVAGAMLIHMLIHGGVLMSDVGCRMSDVACETIYDMSVGYDLAGIRSAPVRSFIEQMRDASKMVERLRAEIPAEYPRLRNLDYPTRLSTSITLSTFHGCPAEEIERICEFLLTEMDCDVIIKMNPPMLGKERLEHLLHEVMGYRELTVHPHAYSSGLQFDESLDIVDRLSRLAASRGRRLGAKFSNTLEVVNHRSFFTPENKVMYLSGQPLHVITLTLADVFRQAVGPDLPLTFSAGVDRQNFANMVACGFRPISTSTDLLRPGGYGRLPAYLTTLAGEMKKVDAATIDEYIVKTGEGSKGIRVGGSEGRETNTSTSSHPPAPEPSNPSPSPWAPIEVIHAAAANLRRMVPVTQKDRRYYAEQNAKAPKRIDSHLVTFDCITCDKCIPVCPNDANFTFKTDPQKLEFHDFVVRGAMLEAGEPRRIVVERGDQIANFADFCNDCGNCDTFCPEYGGPFIKKPNFFGSFAAWNAGPRDGFFIDLTQPAPVMHGRIMGKTFLLAIEPQWDGLRFEDGAVCLFLSGSTHKVERWFAFGPRDATGHVIDMTACHTMRILLQSLLRGDRVHQINIRWLSREQTAI